MNNTIVIAFLAIIFIMGCGALLLVHLSAQSTKRQREEHDKFMEEQAEKSMDPKFKSMQSMKDVNKS